METLSLEKTQEIVQAVQGLYARKDPAHDLEHALRVRSWGQKIAVEENANIIVIELAALLHDIGRSGTVEKTHAESSAGLAETILQKNGYSQEIILQVKEAVIAHSRETCEPQSLEAKILYDADKLDYVGAVGIARLFSLAGSLGIPLFGENSCESFYHERIKKYEQYLNTDSAKRYFRPLFSYMEDFWIQIKKQMT